MNLIVQKHMIKKLFQVDFNWYMHLSLFCQISDEYLISAASVKTKFASLTLTWHLLIFFFVGFVFVFSEKYWQLIIQSALLNPIKSDKYIREGNLELSTELIM